MCLYRGWVVLPARELYITQWEDKLLQSTCKMPVTIRMPSRVAQLAIQISGLDSVYGRELKQVNDVRKSLALFPAGDPISALEAKPYGNVLLAKASSFAVFTKGIRNGMIGFHRCRLLLGFLLDEGEEVNGGGNNGRTRQDWPSPDILAVRL
jgi:hypothetical protein